MEKYAGNLFLNYEPSEKLKFNISAGAQHSIVQKVSTENEFTPLSTASSDSRYADFRANVNGISAQFSYNGGTQTTEYDPGRKYDFNIVAGNIDYKYTKGNLSITPGLSYSSAIYDDSKYSDLINKTGLLNGRGQITTQRASLQGEYRLINNKLRLVAGYAINKFNYPDTGYAAYEFAATYKPNKNNLFRAVFSHAPRSSNIFDTYVSKTISYLPIGVKTFISVELEGNKDPKLLTADMFEIGYRGSIAPGLSIDVELFDIHAKNYNTPVNGRPYIKLEGTDTVRQIPVTSTNIPLELQQNGITVSLAYSSKKLELKPFITVQQTRMNNYAPFINIPDAGSPGALQNNIYSGMGTVATLKSTPTVFGGASIDYMPNSKLNINMNAYYYSSQTYYHLSNIIFHDGIRGIDQINAKLILNASISYKMAKSFRIFCSGKNILNDNSREFFRTDAMPFILLGGFHYEF